MVVLTLPSKISSCPLFSAVARSATTVVSTAEMDLDRFVAAI